MRVDVPPAGRTGQPVAFSRLPGQLYPTSPQRHFVPASRRRLTDAAKKNPAVETLIELSRKR